MKSLSNTLSQFYVSCFYLLQMGYSRDKMNELLLNHSETHNFIWFMLKTVNCSNGLSILQLFNEGLTLYECSVLIVLFSIALNLMIFVLIILRLLVYLNENVSDIPNPKESRTTAIPKHHKHHSTSSSKTKQRQKNNHIKTLDTVIALNLNLYNYLFYIPFITAGFYVIFSDSNTKTAILLAVFSLITSILIGVTQSIHDFSFSFEYTDFLSRIDSSHNQIEIILDTGLVILYATSAAPYLLCFSHILVILIQTISQLHAMCYYDKFILQWNIFTKLINLFYTVLILLAYVFQSEITGQLLALLCLVLLPFTYIIASIALKKQLQKFILEAHNYEDARVLNVHVRAVYDLTKHLDMHDYQHIMKSVLFESIYENHIDTCKRPYCFCEQFVRDNGFSWEELQGYQFRDKFISLYLTDLQKSHMRLIKRSLSHRNKDFNQLCFNYLMFLIEIVNVPTSAFVEVVSIMNEEMSLSSLKEQMIFSSIFYRAQTNFYNFFNNPTIYNQKLQMIKVIEFDEWFTHAQVNLKESLLLSRDMLLILCEEYVDINSLYNYVIKINTLKQATLEVIKKMYKYNPHSRRVNQITFIFAQTLDLSKKSPKAYQKRAQLLQNRHQLNKLMFKEREVMLFSQDACVIYITLLDPIGVIKQASLSTKRVFGYLPQELFNKNCTLIIPDQLKNIHDNILKRFVKSGTLNGINAGELQIFGIKNTGFAAPLLMRIRLDQTHHNDFGASAFFQEHNTVNPKRTQLFFVSGFYQPLLLDYFQKGLEYIIFSVDGQICNVSKKIHTKLFSRIFSEKELNCLKQYNIFKMMPTLQINVEQVFESNQLTIDSELTSLFVFPYNEDNLNVFEHLKDTPFNCIEDYQPLLKSLNLHDFKFFSICFKIGRLSTTYKAFQLNYIAIERATLIRTKSEVRQAVRSLKSEIEKKKQYIQVAIDMMQDSNMSNLRKSIKLTKATAAATSMGIMSFTTKALARQSVLKFQNLRKTDKNPSGTNSPAGGTKKTTFYQTVEQIKQFSENTRLSIDNTPKNSRKGDSFMQKSSPMDVSIQIEALNINNIPRIDSNNNNNNNVSHNINTTNADLLMNISNVSGNGLVFNNNTTTSALGDEKRRISLFSDRHIGDKNPQDEDFQDDEEDEEQEVQIKTRNLLESLFSSQEGGSDLEADEQICFPQSERDEDDRMFTASQKMIQTQKVEVDQDSTSDDNEQSDRLAKLKHSSKAFTSHNNNNNENGTPMKNTKRNSKIKKRVTNNNNNNNSKAQTNLDQNKEENALTMHKASSVNSSSSEFHTFKNILLAALRKGYQSRVMRVLYFFGILAILMFIGITTFFFVFIRQQFDREEYCYRNALKGYPLMYLFSSMLMQVEYFRMYDQGIFTPMSIPAEEAFYRGYNPTLLVQVKQRIIDFINLDRNTLFGQYLRTETSMINMYSLNNVKSVMYQVKIYHLVTWSENMYFYSTTNYDAFPKYMFNNQKTLFATFQQIADLALQEAQEQTDYLSFLLVFSVVVLELFTLILTCQLIPIFYYIQTKREKILKLLCTFQPIQLRFKIMQSEFFASQDILSRNDSKVILHKDIFKMKKRTSSSTNDLPKINKTLILISAVVFGVFSMYPIGNYIITRNFIDEFQNNIMKLNTVYSLQGISAQLFGLNVLRQTGTIQNKPSDTLTGIDGQISIVSSQVDVLIDQLLLTLKQQNPSDIYNGEQEEIIVNGAINGDTCGILQNYQSDYLPGVSNIMLNYHQCSELDSGIWKNGYLVALRQISQNLAQLKQIYAQNLTPANFKIALKNFYLSINGTYLIQSYYYLGNVPKFVGNYLMDSSKSFYNEQLIIDLVIFLIVIAIASTAFFYLWNKYYYYLISLIQNTTQAYGLFSYDFIHDNPFISNYVKKEYST